MKGKIFNLLLTAVVVGWTAGVFLLTRQYFPRVIETEIEIQPTEHELNELALQIAEGEIQKAKEIWEANPKIIYLAGKDSTKTDTVKIYATSSIDIAKSFEWSFVFPNENRAADSLYFEVQDSLKVTTYADSAEKPYIGYDSFLQEIKNLKLVVNPEFFRIEKIDRFSLWSGIGFGLETEERLIDQAIRKDSFLSVQAELIGMIDEKYYSRIFGEVNSRSQTFGVSAGIKLFSFGSK
jgi:hypothetical protein